MTAFIRRVSQILIKMNGMDLWRKWSKSYLGKFLKNDKKEWAGNLVLFIWICCSRVQMLRKCRKKKSFSIEDAVALMSMWKNKQSLDLGIIVWQPYTKSLKNLGKINWAIGVSFQFLLLPLSLLCFYW